MKIMKVKGRILCQRRVQMKQPERLEQISAFFALQCVHRHSASLRYD